MSGKTDLEIKQGANFIFEFELLEEDETGNYIPVNLVDATPDMQIRSSYRSNTPILDLGENGYITVSDVANGKVKINVPASVTNDLDFTTALYDIILTFNIGTVEENIIRLAEGKVYLSPGVTR